MSEQNVPTEPAYPLGRGYGHDYMRGGEVLGGYGYSARDEYERPRGERNRDARPDPGTDGPMAELDSEPTGS